MSNHHVNHLLIGGGISVSEAARAIRRLQPNASVMLVTREATRPYQRPELSRRYLRRELPREAVMTLPVQWFVENNVTLRTARRATSIDVSRHCVTLDTNESVYYDNVLIATGAFAKPLKVPGANLPGVHYLRTLDDVDRLHHVIDAAKLEGRSHDVVDAREGRRLRGRAVVIGAGVLGVETAASLRQLKLHVELVASHAHPWHSFAGESIGRCVTRHLETAGVVVHTSPATAVEGDGRAQRVVLGNGTKIDTDFVVACVGIEQNRELLRGTPVAAEKAILVDPTCRTNVEGVFAAGDCSAIFDARFGKHVPATRYELAAHTGQLAGTNMAGGSERFSRVIGFTSLFLGKAFRSWGESRFVDRRVVRQLTPTDLMEIGLDAEGRVAQVIATGELIDETSAKLIENRTNLTGREDTVRDPNVPLSQLLS